MQFNQLKRREFVTLLGSATAWPLAARAQQPKMPAIGLLDFASLELSQESIAGFHRGLAETGYVEGQNVTIEYRGAEGRSDRLPTLAADLIRRQVARIVRPAMESKLATWDATGFGLSDAPAAPAPAAHAPGLGGPSPPRSPPR
jgi:putative tryptophan/tyrosine transport system substrate-binding protein